MPCHSRKNSCIGRSEPFPLFILFLVAWLLCVVQHILYVVSTNGVFLDPFNYLSSLAELGSWLAGWTVGLDLVMDY